MTRKTDLTQSITERRKSSLSIQWKNTNKKWKKP